MAWAKLHGSFDIGSRISFFIAMFLYFSLVCFYALSSRLEKLDFILLKLLIIFFSPFLFSLQAVRVNFFRGFK